MDPRAICELKEMSPRTKNVLASGGYLTVSQVAYAEDISLLRLPRCGWKTMREIRILIPALDEDGTAADSVDYWASLDDRGRYINHELDCY